MTADDFDAFLARCPAAARLAIAVVERAPGRAVLTKPVEPVDLQVDAYVHGGVVATLADTAAVWLFLPDLAEGERMTSIDLKLDFVRPAVDGNGELVATAREVRRGRRVAFADVEVEQGGKLVAKGLFTYLVFATEDV